VRATPESVCEADAFRTTVELDASDSTPSLTLVPVERDPTAPPLVFAWGFAGAAHEERGRDASGAKVRIGTAGDRPLHVTLAVRNAEDGQAETLFTLPITVPEVPRPCDAASACAAGEACLGGEGEALCAPDAPCAEDADCAVCSSCDAAVARCLPRRTAP
jgi:hypothetical protein